MLILWGEDFSHVRADWTYDLLDQIIGKVEAENLSERKKPKLKIHYSTISEYFAAVHSYANKHKIEWPVLKPADYSFQVYEQHPGQYWSGYYTTNPWIKREIRKFMQHTHTEETMHAISLFDQLLDTSFL